MNSVILDIYKDSLEYSAKDFKTLLILGVTYFLSFLFLPIFLIYGYSYRVTKISVEGMINGNDPLPEFDNVIDMFVDGIKVVLTYLVYLLVPFIIFILFAIVSSSIGGYGESALMVRSIGAYLGLIIISFAITAAVFLLIFFVFGFFGIITGTLGFSGAAGGIFVAGLFISYFAMLFVVSPYTMILQSRVSGLLYNLH